MLFTAINADAQQTSFTQYMDNLTPVNAAYSIRNDGLGTVSTTLRKQWEGVPGAPTTFLFNGDFPISSINGAAGLIIRDDQFSVEHLTTINAFFAKGIQVGDFQRLAVAINAGFRSYIANYNTLDNTDPLLVNINQVQPDVGFGVMFYDEDYYLGVSVPEINIRTLGIGSTTPNDNLRNNYYITGAFYAHLDDEIKIKPATLIAYTSSVPLIADISTTAYIKETFGIGLNYRTNGDVAAIFSLNFDTFHFGYSYQFGTSSTSIGGYSNATHEIMLSYHFGKPNQVPVNIKE